MFYLPMVKMLSIFYLALIDLNNTDSQTPRGWWTDWKMCFNSSKRCWPCTLNPVLWSGDKRSYYSRSSEGETIWRIPHWQLRWSDGNEQVMFTASAAAAVKCCCGSLLCANTARMALDYDSSLGVTPSPKTTWQPWTLNRIQQRSQTKFFLSTTCFVIKVI